MDRCSRSHSRSSGEWLGGVYAPIGDHRSYAAGHPHPSDIYLAGSIPIHQRTGAFIVNERGQPVEIGPGILVRWDEIEYLTFVEES